MAKTAFTALIQQTANKFALPFALLEAQVVEESSGLADNFRWEPQYYRHYIAGNPRAIAGHYGPLAACSFGLLQIMFETAVEQGFAGRPEELFDPQTGIEAGARYLRHLWDLAGATDATYKRALAAYNGGPSLLRLADADWPIGPQTYVNNIYRIAGVTA